VKGVVEMRAATIAFMAMLMMMPGLIHATVPDYLKPGFYEASPAQTAEINQLVSARLVLEGSTPVPDEARLNISTEAVRPRVEVVIDGKLETYGAPSIEIPLPSEGVKEVEIYLYGVAPKVTKETQIPLLDVKTYVKYKGEEGVYQEEKRLMVTVTNIVISGAVETINKAKMRLELMENRIASLRSSGADIGSIETKLENARSIIKTADALYKKGDVEIARDAAESALKVLDDVSAEADKIETAKETKQDIKRYGFIALGIIIFGALLLLFRKRRDELG
jgi:hypothetical protein